MSWWLVLSIIGVIAAGVLVGLLVSYIILRAKRKSSTLAGENKIQGNNIVRESPESLVSEVPQVMPQEIKPKPVISIDDKVDVYLKKISNLEISNFQAVDKANGKKPEALIMVWAGKGPMWVMLIKSDLINRKSPRLLRVKGSLSGQLKA